MNGIGAPCWQTVHQQSTPRHVVHGTPTRVVSHAAPTERLRRVDARPSVTHDDSACALVLRDHERARLAAWAECERRPIANDGFARAALWSRKDV